VYEALVFLNHPERRELLRNFWDVFKKLEEDEIFSYDYRKLMKLVNDNTFGERRSIIHETVRLYREPKTEEGVKLRRRNTEENKYRVVLL
jgi:hypothetical protein